MLDYFKMELKQRYATVMMRRYTTYMEEIDLRKYIF